MNDISKRLVEVECILNRLENAYKEKIPKELWDYISENKDKNYLFKMDKNVILTELDLNIDTIAMLTYINMKYLLPKEQKEKLENLLNMDKKHMRKIKRINII